MDQVRQRALCRGPARIFALLYRGDPAAALLPMLCGLGLGLMLPDRVLTARIQARARSLRSAVPARWI